MKNKLLFTTLFFYSISFFAQQTKDLVTLHDSLGYTTQNKENYYYSRIVLDYYIPKNLYEINEYYKSGKLKKKCYSKNNFCMLPEGIYIDYYENGNKKQESNYINSLLTGKVLDYYENGNLKSETEFSDGFHSKILKFWDKNNLQTVVNGNGEMEVENKDEIENISEKGNLKNGHKDGIWIGKDKKNNFTYTENYINGKFIEGKSIDLNGVEHKYTTISELVQPKNGFGDFQNKFFELFPPYKRKENDPIENIRFTINSEGKITDIDTSNVVKEKDKKKVIKFLSNYGDWNPEIIRGIKVPYTFEYNL